MNRKKKGLTKETELDKLLRQLSVQPENVNELRQEILQQATYLIDEILEEFLSSGLSRQRLFHAGYLGLLNAVYNLELARGKNFQEYARNLIKGELRQHIRQRVKRTRSPHWLQDLNQQIETAEASLLHESGRLPSLGELSEKVNITEEGIAEIFRAREALNYISLNEKQRREDSAPSIDQTRIRSKHPEAFPVQYRVLIASALEKLGDLQELLLDSLFPISKT